MNKLIVLSGGSKGIGRAILLKFAKEGFDIITCARKEKDLQSLQEEIKQIAPTIHFQYISTDLSQKSGVEVFINFINTQKRTIDVLVNNAGVYIPGQISTEPDGNLEAMIHQNLYSAYYLTRGVIGPMMEAKNGHIFTICSVASIQPYINGGSYCISKYALIGMSKVLREEMKMHNVKVTAIVPGATKTASWDQADLPDDRFIKPEDIGEIIWCAYMTSAFSLVEEIVIRPLKGDI